MMFKARKDRADFDISIVVSDALGGHLGVWSGEWPQVVLAEVGGARLSGRAEHHGKGAHPYSGGRLASHPFCQVACLALF